MFMHAKTDSAEVQRVNAALRTVLARPDVRERMQKIVFEPAYSSPQDMAKLVRSGVAMWEPVIRASGWVPQ
jgi:tripartite-type tricarboxylate transporter receptor subunit TctC